MCSRNRTIPGNDGPYSWTFPGGDEYPWPGVERERSDLKHVYCICESEVVSLVAQNKDVADIIHGLNVSVASKVGALAARLGKKNPGEYMMTGGVARNKGIIQALEEKLGAKLYICDEAQLCGALGAALFAYEKCNAAR